LERKRERILNKEYKEREPGEKLKKVKNARAGIGTEPFLLIMCSTDGGVSFANICEQIA